MFLKSKVREDKNTLFDTDISLESEAASIVGFLFRSLHFRASFFAHCLSLTDFLIIFSINPETVHMSLLT
jgi:hypothetical protein